MKILKLPVFLFVISALAAPNVSKASTIYSLVSTTKTGANTTVDSSHESRFKAPSVSALCPSGVSCAAYAISYFAPTFDWLLGGGSFVIKTNKSTTDSIALRLYDMTGASTLPGPTAAVASSTVAAASFTDQQFHQTLFLFSGGPFLMLPGHVYMARLTSGTGNNGSKQYDIKTPTDVRVADSSGHPPVAPPSPVPEPPSLITAALGAGLLSFNYLRTGRRRRSR